MFGLDEFNGVAVVLKSDIIEFLHRQRITRISASFL